MKNETIKEVMKSDMFSHIPQMNYLPRWGVLLLDLFLCSIAFWLSVWAGSGFFHYVDIAQLPVPIGVQYIIVMLMQIVCFWAFHTYSGILRYSTFIDTIKVLLSNVTVGGVLIAFNCIMEYLTDDHPILNAVLVAYVPLDDERVSGA